METHINEVGIRPTLLTDGSGSILPPVVRTAERNGDGEGDGREIAATVNMLEVYANGGDIAGLRGSRIAEIVTDRNRATRQVRRNAVSIPMGTFTLQHTLQHTLPHKAFHLPN